MERFIHCAAILSSCVDGAQLETISDAPPKPPHAEALTESERAALHGWAAKHGFVLLNDRDIELAVPVWRQTLAKRATA